MTRTSAHDEMERLRAADPLADRTPEGAAPDAVLATIRRRVAGPSSGLPGRRQVRRRSVTVALATVGLMGTATIGYAVWSGGESLSIGCVSGDQLTVINAVSSDPVADCVASLATAGETVDPGTLTTFVTDDGMVVVAPDQATSEDAVMGGLAPAPGLELATGLLELRMAIDDLVTGVPECSDAETVKDRASAIAQRLGFGHWEIVERERPAGTHCGWGFADLEAQHIVVVYDGVLPSGAVAHGSGGPDGPVPVPFGDVHESAVEPSSTYEEIVAASQEIHDVVGGSCLTAAEAEHAARAAVAAAPWADTVHITVNVDAAAGCARVHTNAYGRYEVTIFGP